MTDRDLSAAPEEGQEILRILESSPAKGGIELLYTRRPDALFSYRREAGESRVFVSREQGKVIGTCAELIRDVYIGGLPSRAAYLCGMKKDAARKGQSGFDASLFRALVREDIDCYFCSVVSENLAMRAMFGRKSRLLEATPLQEYTTYILNPKNQRRLRSEASDCRFRQAEKGDESAILEFLRKEGSKKDLFPVISSLEPYYGLKIEDFYLLETGGKIAAAAALWDQTEYKQYLVKKYRGILKLARLLNPILSLFGYIRLPKENQYCDFPMLSFFLSRDDNPEYYKCFLSNLGREISKKCSAYVIGVPKNHFAAKIYDRLPGVRIHTVIYSLRFPAGEVKKIDKDRIYPECGLL